MRPHGAQPAVAERKAGFVDFESERARRDKIWEPSAFHHSRCAEGPRLRACGEFVFESGGHVLEITLSRRVKTCGRFIVPLGPMPERTIDHQGIEPMIRQAL